MFILTHSEALPCLLLYSLALPPSFLAGVQLLGGVRSIKHLSTLILSRPAMVPGFSSPTYASFTQLVLTLLLGGSTDRGPAAHNFQDHSFCFPLIQYSDHPERVPKIIATMVGGGSSANSFRVFHTTASLKKPFSVTV